MSENPFDSLAQEYDSWFDDNPETYQIELATVRSLLPTFTTAVDIGVGTGRFTRELGISVGLEPSHSMAAIASNRGLHTIYGFAEDLPFFDNSYDLLTMITVTCFLADIEKGFREAWRVLKPGGHLMVAFINGDSRLGQIYETARQDDPFYKDAVFHTTAEMLSLMSAAGFEDLTTAQVNLNQLLDTPGGDADPDTADFVVIRGQRR